MKCEGGLFMEPACLSLRALWVGLTLDGAIRFAGTSMRLDELDDVVVGAFDCVSNSVRY